MKRDGYVLLITIVITLLLTLTTITLLTVVYRYTGTIARELENSSKNELIPILALQYRHLPPKIR